MGYSLIISARVEKELQAAVDYYDSINTELSEKFLAAVDIAFDSLIEHLQYYSFVNSTKDSSLRDIKIATFPFIILFKIKGNVVIMSSIHNTNKKR